MKSKMSITEIKRRKYSFYENIFWNGYDHLHFLAFQRLGNPRCNDWVKSELNLGVFRSKTNLILFHLKSTSTRIIAR